MTILSDEAPVPAVLIPVAQPEHVSVVVMHSPVEANPMLLNETPRSDDRDGNDSEAPITFVVVDELGKWPNWVCVSALSSCLKTSSSRSIVSRCFPLLISSSSPGQFND